MARTVRSTGGDTTEAIKNLDAIETAIADIPEIPWTEGNTLTVTFTGATLDQTIAHKLSGPLKGAMILDLFEVSGVDRVARYKVAAPVSENTHVRLVASGACVAQVWVWR